MTKASDLIKEFSEQVTPHCVNLGSNRQCVTGCLACEEKIVPQGGPCPYTDDFENCPCFRQSRPYRGPWEKKDP